MQLQTCPINILLKVAIDILLKVTISKNNSETLDPEDIGNAMALFILHCKLWGCFTVKPPATPVDVADVASAL